MDPDTCPRCRADLRGDPIPEASREMYGDSTHYLRAFGIEIRGVYDGVLFWVCPECEHAWHYWDPITYGRRAAKAEEAIARWNRERVAKR